MALGSTQSLVKMSARNIPGVKGGRCIRLTTYHHTMLSSRNLGTFFLDPSGPAWPVTGVLYLYLYSHNICLEGLIKPTENLSKVALVPNWNLPSTKKTRHPLGSEVQFFSEIK